MKEETDPRKLLIKIAKILKELKIPYLVTGGVAVLIWGRPRFTADIDILSVFYFFFKASVRSSDCMAKARFASLIPVWRASSFVITRKICKAKSSSLFWYVL